MLMEMNDGVIFTKDNLTISINILSLQFQS